jgi:hypothetical protein
VSNAIDDLEYELVAEGDQGDAEASDQVRSRPDDRWIRSGSDGLFEATTMRQ